MISSLFYGFLIYYLFIYMHLFCLLVMSAAGNEKVSFYFFYSCPIFEKSHVAHHCCFIHHVSCCAHTKAGLLQTAQEVNDLKAQ